MSYATQLDIESRYPGALKITGPVSAGVLDEAAIALALLDASTLADGYLRSAPYRFTVPWPDPAPEWLVALVVDIGLYRATTTVGASLDVFKDRRQRYEDALALLESIAAGKYNPNPVTTTTGTVAGVVSVSSRERLFGRGCL